MARDVEMYDENILLDYPPDHVTIGDTEYRINSDFRVSILFELLISDPEVPDDRKLLQALRLYYGDDIPPDIPEAIRMIKWFYGGGKKLKDEENKAEDEEEKASAEPPSFSFEHDAPYIYSAFLQQYGVDLVEEDLHWWKFRALLVSLTEDCKFVKIIGYRTMDIDPKLSAKQRAFYEKMKREYRLPLSEAEQKREDAIVAALMGDGNVSGLL